MSNTEPNCTLSGPITILPTDDPKKLRLEWIIKEKIGIIVINDYAIAAINLPDPPTPLPPEVYDHILII